MPSVEMKNHEFARGLEEACKKLGVAARIAALGLPGEPPGSDVGMQFSGDKVSVTVKTDTGKLYEMSLEVAER